MNTIGNAVRQRGEQRRKTVGLMPPLLDQRQIGAARVTLRPRTIRWRRDGREGSATGRQPQDRTRDHTVGETAAGMRCVVMWFRRDIRLADHPALSAAAATGLPVVPLFVVDPAFAAARAHRATNTCSERCAASTIRSTARWYIAMAIRSMSFLVSQRRSEPIRCSSPRLRAIRRAS